MGTGADGAGTILQVPCRPEVRLELATRRKPMDAKQTMRGRRLPLKHCLLPMAALLTALAALPPFRLR